MSGSDGTHWRDNYSGPIEPGETFTFVLKSRRDKFQGDQKIGDYLLYAPQEPGLYESWHSPDLPFHSARLTLTYCDASKNKYTQVFDYDHFKRVWTCLSRPTHIEV